jgi:hypothetical protein
MMWEESSEFVVDFILLILINLLGGGKRVGKRTKI